MNKSIYIHANVLNCHLATFCKYHYNSKKQPNGNLKHLHVYICSCSYSLPATNMMACLTTKYISPCSYQSPWPPPDISSLSYHRLYTPYGYETHKRHCLHAVFVPLCYIRRPFTANSSFQNFIHKIIKLVESYK